MNHESKKCKSKSHSHIGCETRQTSKAHYQWLLFDNVHFDVDF